MSPLKNKGVVGGESNRLSYSVVFRTTSGQAKNRFQQVLVLKGHDKIEGLGRGDRSICGNGIRTKLKRKGYIMSNHLKSSLLAATAAVVVSAVPAHAQLVYPSAELRGMGATSVQDMWPREANCIGGFKPTGTTGLENSFTVNADDTVSPRNLGNAKALAVTPTFDCSTQSFQQNISVRYIGIGSGGSRKILTATSALTGYAANGIKLPSGTAIAPANPSAAIFGSDITTWGNAHYALSDSPAGQSDIDTLKQNHLVAGAFIQVPLYVLPVALAYNPVYAHVVYTADTTVNDASGNPILHKAGTPTGATYKFNVQATAADAPNGGLRLSKVAYCNIVNGVIKNWNDPRIAATNWQVDLKGKPVISKTTKSAVLVSLKDAADDATRWSKEGAPIRLVGRLDKSGTTDIFTRHINNACSDSLGTVTNKFLNPAESLPFDATSGINLREFRGDTNYYPTSLDLTSGAVDPVKVASHLAGLAGTSNVLNGVVYKNGVEGFVGQTSGFTASEGLTTSATTGTNGGGKFIVASGGGNVIAAINASFASSDTSLKDFFGHAVFAKNGLVSEVQVYETAGTPSAAVVTPDAIDTTLTHSVVTTTTTVYKVSDQSVYGTFDKNVDTVTSTTAGVAPVVTTTFAYTPVDPTVDLSLLAAVKLLTGKAIPGALVASADGSLLFNGKIGYISADQVLPAVGAVTSAAALEVGSTYANGTGKAPAFAMPNATTAQAAFGTTVLPPESTKAGKYAAGATGAIVRTNPLDWYNALYAAGSSLANPKVGYPLTGTTQFDTATCFANPDVRNAVATFLTTLYGFNVTDSAGKKQSKDLFTGIKKPGIRAQYNIAPLPTVWTTAIYNTFLIKSKDAGSLGLYLQDGLPGKNFMAAYGLKAGATISASTVTTTGAVKLPAGASYPGAGKKSSITYTEGAANPSCTAGLGQ